MIKFGRKFFFDRVHTKRNYTIPIIISLVLVVAIISTFLITRYFKSDKPEVVEPKVVFKDSVEIEIFNELPNIGEYIKKYENIELEDFTLAYPDDLIFIEDLSECKTEETKNCKKQVVTSIGTFKITISSEKLKKKDNVIKLNVIDKTAPALELQELAITEGTAYQITDFIKSCNDNSGLDCTFVYPVEDKDESGNIIDYSKYTNPGTYTIKIIAKDAADNMSEAIETKLTINKKKTENKPESKPENKPNDTTTCKYGNLKYSSSYVIATKINDTKCAISAKEAENISNSAAIAHNKKLSKEIQTSYLQKTIDAMNLEGQMTYEITYGPVFNTSNKGVVGYFLMAEAKQTINSKTTTIARYYIDENGNRIWKVNTLNLK